MYKLPKTSKRDDLGTWVNCSDAESRRETSGFFWPPAENGESQSLQNFNIVMLIHLSNFGDVFIVNSCHRIILSACGRTLRLLVILD